MKATRAISSILICTIVWISILSTQSNILSANTITNVSVNPTINFAKLHQNFTVSVGVNDVKNLYGVQINVTWTASVLTLVHSDLRIDLKNHTDGVLHDPIIIFRNNITQNNYQIIAVSENPAPAFSGSGNVAVLTFNVNGVGSSEIDLDTILGNSTAQAIPNDIMNGLYYPIQILAVPTVVNVNERVNITGTIAVDQANIPVSIIYKKTTDTAWSTLATVNTDQQGNYFYTWTPNTGGKYDIKATASLAGNPQTSTTFSMVVNGNSQLPWINIGIIAAVIIMIVLLSLFYYQRRKEKALTH